MTDPLALLVLGVAMAVLAWDIALAGWIAARREAPRVFTNLTAFCGLLVAPALLVAVATGTETGARTISGITWLMPMIACAFVLQVLYSLVTRLVSVVVALPILLYDVVIAVIAIGDYLASQQGVAPLQLQAAVSARDVILGMTAGRAALVSPLAMLVPMIAPAYPARWRLSGAVRAVLVLAATALATLLMLEWPRGIAAVRSYEAAYAEPMQARPAGDFAIGMRIFPILDGAPPARAVQSDRRLIEALEPEVVLVVIDEDGWRGGALDSLSRVLQPLRDDSVQIAVALRIARGVAAPDDAERQAAVERVLLRIRPDVIFPGLIDPLPSILGTTPRSSDWWRALLLRSATTVQRVRPRTRMGWSASRLDAIDSAVYVWAASPSSPVSLIGAVSFPSFSGLPAVDARLRAFDRWHQRAVTRGGGAKPHWLVTAGGLPHAHGDAAQLAAIRHALAWGSRRAWVTAAIIGEPADYDGWVGLRAANGRIRSSVPALSRAARQMRDVRPVSPP
ncbi:hypothetical protein [Gemmatimonas groenlandica]|uniref:Uncharacterized protein n=1 Tax=Gemmatimonas groenlandica TaxID=2732249 RepID=A0A6M4IL16_9BACT|nr:hypothetical protein [Gemmatimonas groenlandica]QJR34217.1 hypothetical protein HKW67_01145 [Gemmatimonas groenlandica]